ncbi:hypothetical protein F5Y19DRAFT_317800 [Xylariaceae sp. FL1651]|nr:hypothetical protein F5Y19DRAFT_317800 [Xylariaceae sp. FL1651]
MAPIPVYANSPITAAKHEGVTPKTASAAEPSTNGPGHASVLPTSTYTPSTYAAAQPGAAPALPTPTATAQVYSPAQPTPTTKVGNASPALPQPGAVPVSVPPPPKVGERYQPPTQTAAAHPTITMPYPHQMAIPAPTAPQPSQQRGTSTATTPSLSRYGNHAPSSIDMGDKGAQSLQHPPGYHQNANASGLDRYQRSSMDQRESQEDSGNGMDGVWGAARKLAQQTGERLAAVESEVWKKINKE